MFTALYLPARDDGHNPTQDGFPTREDAEKFILGRMCKECKEELERYERGVRPEGPEDPPATSWPPCACEWIVVETEKLGECEDLGDVFDAAGFERIELHEKENEMDQPQGQE